jgi:hypothetical protein
MTPLQQSLVAYWRSQFWLLIAEESVYQGTGNAFSLRGCHALAEGQRKEAWERFEKSKWFFWVLKEEI